MLSLPENRKEAAQKAIAIARDALADSHTPQRLARYYCRETGYAGSTYAGLGRFEPFAITAEDLLAVTTLSVSIGSRPIRRFLEDTSVQRRVARHLRELPDESLQNVDDSGQAPMSRFYEFVKETLATPGAKYSDRWVTASKIVARKRPDLFPVRDNVVRKALKILRYGDYTIDWPIYQRIMLDEEISQLLNDLPDRIGEAAHGKPVDVVNETPLRLLDAALWMKHSGTAASLPL